MKKLINGPGNVMRESLAGFAAAHSEILKVSFDPVYVVRADAPVTGRVGIISGGGSAGRAAWPRSGWRTPKPSSPDHSTRPSYPACPDGEVARIHPLVWSSSPPSHSSQG